MRQRENKVISKELRKLKKKGNNETQEAQRLKKILGKNKGDLKKSKMNKRVIEAKRKVRKEMEKTGFVNKTGINYSFIFLEFKRKVNQLVNQNNKKKRRRR